jgi:hypothetical protein
LLLFHLLSDSDEQRRPQLLLLRRKTWRCGIYLITKSLVCHFIPLNVFLTCFEQMLPLSHGSHQCTATIMWHSNVMLMRTMMILHLL